MLQSENKIVNKKGQQYDSLGYYINLNIKGAKLQLYKNCKRYFYLCFMRNKSH